MTGFPSAPGSCPSTNGLREAQQQCPSATQHSIEQTSESSANNRGKGDNQPSNNTNKVAAVRNLEKTLFLLSSLTMPRSLSRATET
jgi:hypothetical protein